MTLDPTPKKVLDPILEAGEIENLEDEFDDFDPYDDYYYDIDEDDYDPYEYHDPEETV